jgi:hypothetical protein
MLAANQTCQDWTATTGTAANGHSDTPGSAQFSASWNAAHTVGCGPIMANQNFAAGTISSGGGNGRIYCFATN